MKSRVRALIALLSLAAAGPALAQEAAPPPPRTVQAPDLDRGAPDLPFVPAEPDFTLVSLPTTLRLPAGRWAFRVTHRFTRGLGDGSFGDLASDFFGFDSSAIVGLEVRYGILPGTQIAVLRTSDRTIQLTAQTSILQQSPSRPVAIDAIGAVQGLDNLTESYTTTLGALVSRRFGERGALYVQPLVVLNPLPESATASESAFLLGVGGRARLTESLYVVGEIVPRLAGEDAGDPHASVAIESRKGGHSFQINVSNSFATTLGQIARSYGAGAWHVGFN
nr:DUF5777 family beta-barrel protein [Acidobacteriota bacterium]